MENYELGYIYDFICMFECTEHAQSGVGRLTKALAPPFNVLFHLRCCKTGRQYYDS